MESTTRNLKGVIHATDSSFEKLITESEGPVLVDFWAPWCGPCRMVGPIVEELAKEYDGKIRVVKVNTEDCPMVSQAMGIRSIPTIVMFKGKDVVDHKIGFGSKEDLITMIEKALGNETPGFFKKMFKST